MLGMIEMSFLGTRDSLSSKLCLRLAGLDVAGFRVGCAPKIDALRLEEGVSVRFQGVNMRFSGGRGAGGKGGSGAGRSGTGGGGSVGSG